MIDNTKVMFTTFKCPVQAQEFYLKQKNHVYWHWDYNSEKELYTLEYKQGVHASDEIIHIEELSPEPDGTEIKNNELQFEYIYVYDIETEGPNGEGGTFQCGPGCMIIKNTDSIYTKFQLPKEEKENMSEKQILDRVNELSNECAERITKTFKPPICLENEKIMYPLILVSKKRYAYLGHEQGKSGLENKGIDVKGLQLVRRDNCGYVKTVSNEILENILIEKNILKAEKAVIRRINRLLAGNVDISELIISKSLKSKYTLFNKNGRKLSKPSHALLADRWKERDPMNCPKPGDRVPYVFIENDDKHALQCDRIEEPNYVLEHPETNIDTIYYLEHQVAEPIYTIFGCIIKDSNGNLYPLNKHNKISKECKQKIQRLWYNALVKKRSRNEKQYNITDFFPKQ